MMPMVQTIFGLVLLLFGAEFLIRGAVNLARRLDVSPHVIGLTVVAFGTSLPELVVSMDAAWSGSPGIALGNILGSNIANLLLIGGIGACLAPILCCDKRAHRDTFVMIFATVLLVVALLTDGIARYEGAAMLVLLVAYVAYAYRKDGDQDEAASEVEELARPDLSMMKILLMVAGGLIGLICGGEFLVHGAVALAREFGVSESVIAITLIAFGTSVPEIATVIVAAFRRHGDVALGNIIGSNIFNILAVLGLVATTKPLALSDKVLVQQAWVMLAVTLVFAALSRVTGRLGRRMGVFFIVAYLCFIGFQFGGAEMLAEWLDR